MTELQVKNRQEQHDYRGSREMIPGRKVKIQFTGANEAQETVLEETCPAGESWTVKLSIVKIINND